VQTRHGHSSDSTYKRAAAPLIPGPRSQYEQPKVFPIEISNQSFINNQIKTHPTSTGARNKVNNNSLQNSANEKRIA
jgi:hypothetical protein